MSCPLTRYRRQIAALILCVSFCFAAGRAGAATTFANSIVAVDQGGARQILTPKKTYGKVVRSALTPQEAAGEMEFSIGLKLQNRAELDARIARGEILSREAIEAYLPAASDYATVRAWLVSQGFRVSLDAGTRHAIFVRGAVARVAASLKVSMARVATVDGEFTSAVSAPELPDDIAKSVDHIRGLQPHLIRHPHLRLTQQLEANTYYAITPAAVATVYQAPGNLTGLGQTIAVIGDSGVVSSDLTKFWGECGITQSLSNIVQLSVGAGPGGDTTNQSEVSMDVEWTSGLAPGAMIRVYETSYPLTGLSEAAAYTQILNDLPSNPTLHQVTESYGGNEYGDEQTNGDSALVLLVAQGVTCFASSGDGGSNPDPAPNAFGYNSSSPIVVSYPASDPYMTAVGGTTLIFPQSLDGQSSGPEVAWSVGATGTGGTGGGFSSVFTRPDWQVAAGVPVGSKRTIPDVSALADTGTGDTDMSPLFIQGGKAYSGGGTSLSSPIWAGLCALINQSRSNASLPSVGFLNAKLYAAAGTSSFTDITSGSNGAYQAGAGYDLCTGLGTPLVGNLITLLGAPPPQTAPSFTTNPSSQSVGAGQYASFSVSASSKPTPTYHWQWLLNGGGSWADISDNDYISGSQTNQLFVAGLATLNATSFRCIATNAAGTATSASCTLSVSQPGYALAWKNFSFPSNAYTGAASSGTATVINAGTQAWGPNQFLSLRDPYGTELGSVSLNGVAPGQSITVTLNFTAPYAAVSAAYDLQARDTTTGYFGPLQAFSLSTTGAPIPPNIVQQPVTQNVTAGSSVTFSVVAVGQTPFSYQWKFNGNNIPGATIGTLALVNVQQGNSGTYTVLVSNALGSVLSNACTLTVAAPPAIIEAEAGTGDTIFLRADGTRWILGSGYSGQLGDGTMSDHIYPVQAGTSVTLLRAGTYGYSFFTKVDGTLWAAGFPAGLFAGLSTYEQATPVPVVNATNVVAMAADGNRDLYYIRSDGILWATGQGAFGSPPVQIATDVAAIAAGSAHVIYLKADGTIWGLGNGYSGALGPNNAYSNSYTNPVLVAEGATAIAAGGTLTAYLKADGSLWAFGLLGQGLTQVAANVTGFSVGSGHILFIEPDATLWAVGKNAVGQLGDGTATDRSTPVQVASNVFSVSAGGSHTVFIKTDGSLWGMGDNQSGEISASSSMSSVPVMIASGTAQPPATPAAINATKGLRIGYTQLSWNPVIGASSYEIWRNTTNDSSTATKLATVYASGIYDDVTGLGGVQYYYWIRPINPSGSGAFTAPDVGYSIATEPPLFTMQPTDATYLFGGLGSVPLPFFTVVVTSASPLRYQWQVLSPGSSTWTDTIISPLSGATTATLSFGNAPDLSFNGYRYRCIATNIAGATVSAEVSLTVTQALPAIYTQPLGLTVTVGSGGVLYGVGYDGGAALTYQWSKDGVDINGATGTSLALANLQFSDSGNYLVRVTNSAGTTASNAAAVQVVQAFGVISSAAGGQQSLFVRYDNSLWGMGSLNFSASGQGSSAPLWPNQLATGVTQVAAGTGFTVYLKSDGTLWHGGRYFYPYAPPAGDLVIYTPSSFPVSYYTNSAIQLAGNVTAVSAGTDHIAFIKTDGSLWTMGSNGSGQLGNGNTTGQATPVQVAQNVAKVSAGGQDTFFIKRDGSLWATGNNGYGQLGNGTTSNLNQPIQIATGVQAVQVGDYDAIFLKNDGTLWGMGTNFSGVLGAAVQAPVIQNSTLVGGQQTVPVQIASSVQQIMAGGGTIYFRKADGSTWAMGFGTYGLLGDGGANNTGIPVQIPDADLGRSSAAGDHVLFVHSDGSLWAAGLNFSGQLGDGTTTVHQPQELITGGPLSLNLAPSFIQQPAGQSCALGSTAVLTASAIGAVPLAYQWQRQPVGSESWSDMSNGGIFSGATSATLTMTGVTLAMSGVQFQCVATNALGSATSNSAALTVFVPLPVITTKPASQGVLFGSPINLSVAASSPVALSYQWRKDGSDIPGATSAGYNIASAQLTDSGSYTVVVTNSAGSVTSAAAIVMVATFPVITTQPVSQTTNYGNPATFTVAATSTAPLTYQWKLGGTAVSGATQSSYTITNTQLAVAGNYTVDVTNAAGTVTSNIATLTVLGGPPVITTHPQARAVLIASATSFSVVATGTPTPTYQWQRLPAGGSWAALSNAGVYSGATTASLSISAAALALNGDQYRCVVTNALGTAISNAAPLTVGVAGFPKFSAGRYHSLRLDAGGQLFATGANTYGQLGNGNTATISTPQLLTIPGQTIVDMAAGGQHSMILTSAKDLWVTGYNANGQLGDGTTAAKSTPFKLTSSVVGLAAGVAHSAYLKSDGSLWTVGGNDSGQLGDGTSNDRATPQQVATGVVDVSAGVSQTIFLKSDGTVWGMGDMNGSGTVVSTPVQIATGATAIAAGAYHSLILKSDGTLWGLGYNAYGALGNGTTTVALVPVQIATGVRAVAAGYFHSLFIKTDNTLWATGRNSFGQLGDGTTTARSLPFQVAAGVAGVSAGESYTLFTKTDGSLWASGLNGNGQFGNGNLTTVSTPVQIATGVILAPDIPAALTATPSIALDRMHLVWQPLGNATTYEVWRNTANDTNGATQLASGIRWSIYEDLTAINGPTYYYWVKAVNSTATSAFSPVASASFTPTTAPAITTDPQSQTVSVGANVTFTVAASGTAPFTYQWRKGGNAISAAVATSYSLTSVTTADAGSYDVLVTNSAGSAPSNPATLAVNLLSQTITFNPIADQAFSVTPLTLSATADSGLSVTFSVVSGPAAIAGNSLTLTGVGGVIVRASQVGNASYSAAPDADQSFTVTANFSSWAQGKFTAAELLDPNISGPNAVYGHDGLPNLVKYALGLDPKVDATSGLPAVSTTASDWTYTYTRPSNMADVNYTVEMSTDLVNWTSVGVTHELVSSAGGADTWHGRVPLSTGANVYFRLKVVR